jgi:endonuclease/exonuclease/phosphatase family metal-dependent hydrolase
MAISTIRVVAWNIAEGTNDRKADQFVCLNAISAAITNRNIDIVLLNEVCAWNAWTLNGVDQIAWLAQRCGYPYVQRVRTATLFLRGEKYVAVLSRIPLLSVARIQHSAYADGGGYATAHVTANLHGRKCHIFSTRFTAYSVAENIASHLTLRDVIAAIPDNEAVILGGDLNTRAGADANWPASQSRIVEFADFANPARLRDVRGEGWSNQGSPVDHILIRGPWTVAQGFFEDPVVPNPPSDHPWVFAELAAMPDAVPPRDPLVAGASNIFDGNGWLGLMQIQSVVGTNFAGTLYGQAMEGSWNAAARTVQFRRHLGAGYDQVFTGRFDRPGILVGSFQEVLSGITQPQQYFWRAASSLVVEGNGFPGELRVTRWDVNGAVAGQMYGDVVTGQWDRTSKQLELTRRGSNPNYVQQWIGRRVTPSTPTPNPVPPFEFVGDFKECVNGAWQTATFPWVLRERL